MIEKEHPPDWVKIVDRHAQRVFRIAWRILGSEHDAEDVCQAVFIEAQRIQQAGPIQSWSGLFARLATTRAIDALRRRRNTIELNEGDLQSCNGPHEHAVGQELAAWLREAVSRLPEQQAAVFSLVYFEQLERDEVAAVLTISPEAVSTALHKARQRLNQMLHRTSGVKQS